MTQYGQVRVDFITYTTGVAPNEANVTANVSGLFNSPTFSGNVLINGTVAASSTGGLNLNNSTSGSVATQLALRCSGTGNAGLQLCLQAHMALTDLRGEDDL